MNKTEKFTKEAEKVHGDKYNYSLVDYISSKKKIKIICPEHGIFEQTPEKHIRRKQKCPKCHGFNRNTNEVINLLKLKHGDKYDYSLVDYKTAHEKIKIICPEHGVFEQRCSSHLNGSGCPKCDGKNKTSEDYIKEAQKVHGDKYDYSLVDYKTAHEKIKIICKIHGQFSQDAASHLMGHGCSKCFGNIKKNTEGFIIEAKLKHGDKYDYSLVDYKKNNIKIKIICPVHGVFEQAPITHLKSNCFKCRKSSPPKETKEYIKEAIEVHGDKYDYSETQYILAKEKIKILCPKHGEFWQEAHSHLRGCGCPKCSITNNIKENKLKNLFKELGIEFIENDRSILNGKELDIFIPSLNIAFEFNGVYWHSETFVGKNFHLNKTDECEKKNIQLVHLFEDEWEEKRDIVESRIKNMLGLNQKKIFGRKCIIKEISNSESEKFMNENHIQGHSKSSINVGLFYNNELVSLMLFKKEPNKEKSFYLNRFVSKLNYNVIGGASKLLKYFEETYKPIEIITFADRRWSTGKLYDILGFNKEKIIKPSYWYIKNGKRYHKSNFRKDKLEKMGIDITNKTEDKIMKELKYHRIFDSGLIRYKKTLE
jgi:hypothetical protein